MHVTEQLELAGNCVLSIIYPTNPDKDAYTAAESDMLDAMHKAKIRLADAIFVVDVNGYIGSSTRSEIAFAKSLGKEVFYYSKKDLLQNRNSQ